MDLSVELAPRHKHGLRLANPVMAASGTFGYGTEYASVFDVQRLGAIVCKGTTLRPRRGNRQPRVAETPAGMLNSIGLQNIGVRALIRDKAPVWASGRVPVIVNIAGETIDEYRRVAAALEGVPGVSGLELNISCPNVAAGGMAFGASPDVAAAVTSAVRSATTLPLIVKLTPNVTDVVAIAKAAVAAGADALSLINTLLGMSIDVEARQPWLGNTCGGLSGPAVRPIAVRMVWEVAGAVDVPIVGVGGIASAEDALEFLMAGATAVQVGSATFARPRAPLEVLEGLEVWLSDHNVQDIRDVIGAARRR